MPSRNRIKDYVEDGVYHIYNRGIDRQEIFRDKKDYAYFLYLIKFYLSDPQLLRKEADLQGRSLRRSENNFYEKVDLLCYCLMPNHFHLLVKQKGIYDITDFMKGLMTSYSMYFNLKYKRTGTLFQGRYKAILIKNDDYLIHLSRYIHMNPLQGPSLQQLFEYDYSSYADYLGMRDTKWINRDLVLCYFENNRNSELFKSQTYKDFVEDFALDSKLILGELVLE